MELTRLDAVSPINWLRGGCTRVASRLAPNLRAGAGRMQDAIVALREMPVGEICVRSPVGVPMLFSRMAHCPSMIL